MSGYIKIFENGGKSMSFEIKYDDLLDKYDEIWEKMKTNLNTKFHNMLVHDEKYKHIMKMNQDLMLFVQEKTCLKK